MDARLRPGTEWFVTWGGTQESVDCPTPPRDVSAWSTSIGIASRTFANDMAPRGCGYSAPRSRERSAPIPTSISS